ncbi:MAG: hypothetical protein JWP44_3781 [Mucilaginibacter sp.]|nr:hypothetical protein [Mucilaginibacter sp.]
MDWYNYPAAFFAGAFLANAIPHFTHGISGNKFPSPFSKPPGKGLSSPTVNVLWAMFNFIVGYLLFGAGHINSAQPLPVIIFFVGATVMSIMLSINFQKKEKE